MNMEVAYISFANQTEVSIGQCVPAGLQWRKDAESEFQNQPDILQLKQAIDSLRGEWDSGVSKKCRPLYLTALHEQKKKRQTLWIEYLEAKLCKSLEDYINTISRKISPESLIVAALPEFFWRDIDDLKKHSDPNKPDTFIQGYGQPFYGSVFETFVSNQAPVEIPKQNEPCKTLRQLTGRYKNLIVFAGTVWWKRIIDAKECFFVTGGGGCGGANLPTGSVAKICTALVRQSEKMFNTLPVFYQGRRIHLWNKQWVSHIDGLGGYYDKMEKFSARSFQLSAFSGDSLSPLDSVITGLSSEAALSTQPIVIINHCNTLLWISMDICLDFAQGYDIKTKARVPSAPMSLCLFPIKPDIQILIAGGMPMMESHITAKTLFLRCDAVPFAPVLNASANKPSLRVCADLRGAGNVNYIALPAPSQPNPFTGCGITCSFGAPDPVSDSAPGSKRPRS